MQGSSLGWGVAACLLLVLLVYLQNYVEAVGVSAVEDLADR